MIHQAAIATTSLWLTPFLYIKVTYPWCTCHDTCTPIFLFQPQLWHLACGGSAVAPFASTTCQPFDWWKSQGSSRLAAYHIYHAPAVIGSGSRHFSTVI